MKKEFFTGNRKRIAETLEQDSLMVLFAGQAPHASSDMSYYPFVPNRNFYYLTGIEQEESILLIEKNGPCVSETLFIKKSNPDEEKWNGAVLSEKETKEISGIETISFIDDFDSDFRVKIFKGSFQNIYLDFEKYYHGDEYKPAHIFAEDIKKKHPELQVKNIFPKIRDTRTIKQLSEIEETKKAIEATRLGIENVLANARPRMKEYELEAYFDFACKSRGFKETFPSIVVAGKNAWILHYVKNNCVAENGDLVLVDVGAASGHYFSDISRTFPINGKFTKRQREVYMAVLNTQEAVINTVRPGVLLGDLNKLAGKLLTEECKKLGLTDKKFSDKTEQIFSLASEIQEIIIPWLPENDPSQKDDDSIQKSLIKKCQKLLDVAKEDKGLRDYYYHGIGHTLGLDMHDPRDMNPNLRLKEGMIITIEPGLYIKEEGIGVRIEDDILVTRCWHENLSKDIIKDPYEIEQFMQIALTESFNR